MSNQLPFDEIQFLLKAHWVKAWKRETPLPTCKKRLDELHPSSFPFCGIRYAIELVQNGGDAEMFNMPATMEYYCGVGTVAHLIFQKHMRLLEGNGKSKPVMVGDWTCPECGYENKFRPYHKCKKCDSPAIQGEVSRLSGDEISVQIGERTTGHTDDVIKIDNRYWVCDYKTSSVRVVQNYKKFGRGLPYKHNTSQIKSYATLLERKYNIKIAGWFLIYAARDTPAQEVAIVGEEISDEESIELHKALKVADKSFNAIRKYVAPAVNDNKPILNGNSEKLDKLVSGLTAKKICSCKAHYEEYIKDPYDSCSLAESDVCFNGMLERYAKKVFLRVGQDESE